MRFTAASRLTAPEPRRGRVRIPVGVALARSRRVMTGPAPEKGDREDSPKRCRAARLGSRNPDWRGFPHGHQQTRTRVSGSPRGPDCCCSSTCFSAGTARHRSSSDVSADAWEVFSWTDLLCALTVIVAVADRRPGDGDDLIPVRLSMFLLPLAALMTLIVLYRLINQPGAQQRHQQRVRRLPGLRARRAVTYGACARRASRGRRLRPGRRRRPAGRVAPTPAGSGADAPPAATRRARRRPAAAPAAAAALTDRQAYAADAACSRCTGTGQAAPSRKPAAPMSNAQLNRARQFSQAIAAVSSTSCSLVESARAARSNSSSVTSAGVLRHRLGVVDHQPLESLKHVASR